MICEKMPAPGVAGRDAGDNLRRPPSTDPDVDTQVEAIVMATLRAIAGGRVDLAAQFARLAAHEVRRANRAVKHGCAA